MNNRDISIAWAYHNQTKHSFQSVRTIHHHLDWANQPLPFKIYKFIEGIPLPRNSVSSGMSTLDAVSHPPVTTSEKIIPHLETLARLLFFSAGITRRKEHPGGQTFFRAAACTGALYHIDLYLVCGDLPGLGAGVYHFGPHDFALRQLRTGDYRSVLVEAAAGEGSISRAPAVLVMADTYWRNSWKYQARAYRHSFWDSGTILANLLAIASAYQIPARVVASFVDSQVNRLLGIKIEKEAVLALVALGRSEAVAAPTIEPIQELDYPTEPLSPREMEYPAIYDMHRASCLETKEEVLRLRGPSPHLPLPEPQGHGYPLLPLPEGKGPARAIEETIVNRGSTRVFAREPITYPQLSAILDHSTRGIAADFLAPYGSTLNDLYLIVNSVEGLPSGSYLYRSGEMALELLKEGNFREKAGYLGLEQDIPADASVDVFFLADLKPVFQRYGSRGYRLAQLEAGIIGGKMYLSAYGLRLGASGLTFYDDDVIEFFSPGAQGKGVMFLMALGKSIKRKRLTT